MTNAWVPSAGQNESARFRLFCFPHAGGGASAFGAWPRWMPPSVEVVGVHLPGREDRLRTPAFSLLDPMLAALEDALHPYLGLPFAFYGHSLGGWLAFYLARRFRRAGLARPMHIFVAACRAPQLESKHPPIHALSPDLFLLELRRRYNNIPTSIWRAPIFPRDGQQGNAVDVDSRRPPESLARAKDLKWLYRAGRNTGKTFRVLQRRQ